MSSNIKKELKILEKEVERQRRTGAKGNFIRKHRALTSLNLKLTSILAIIFLPLLFDILLWNNMDIIANFWGQIFNFWTSKIGMDGQILYNDVQILGQTVYIPYPDLVTPIPSFDAVMLNIIMCIIVYFGLGFVPKKLLPLTYLLRVATVIQLTASVYFLINPDSFPYGLAEYISSMLTLGIYLMLLTPVLLALIYYIFDFPIWKKIALTTIVIAHLILFLPFQYMLHTLIISGWSLLFMPALYLLFGLLLDILMFIGWYSFAMTWKSKQASNI